MIISKNWLYYKNDLKFIFFSTDTRLYFSSHIFLSLFAILESIIPNYLSLFKIYFKLYDESTSNTSISFLLLPITPIKYLVPDYLSKPLKNVVWIFLNFTIKLINIFKTCYLFYFFQCIQICHYLYLIRMFIIFFLVRYALIF